MRANEKWKRFPNDKTLMISSYGRVFNRLTRKFITGTIQRTSNRQLIRFPQGYLHRMVIATFHGPIGDTERIIFQNYNTFDCSTYNLKVVSLQEAKNHLKKEKITAGL